MNSYRSAERYSRHAAGRSAVSIASPSVFLEGIKILAPILDLITIIALTIWALGLKR